MRNESSIVGRRGSRKGLQLYRDLACKVCVRPSVPHKRLGLAIHMQDFHSNITPFRQGGATGSPRNTAGRTLDRKINLSDSGNFSDLEIIEDDDNDIEIETKDTENVILAEGRNKLKLRDKIYNKDMLEKCRNSNIFQPEVSLCLKLTNAMKEEKKVNSVNKVPDVAPTKSIATKVSDMKASFSRLLAKNMKTIEDDEECLILEESSPPLHMSTPKVSAFNSKRKLLFLTPNTTVVPQTKKNKRSPVVTSPEGLKANNGQEQQTKINSTKLQPLQPPNTPKENKTLQPEVSLSLGLTNAMKKSKNNNEKVPAVTKNSTKTVKENCEIIEENIPQLISTPINPAKRDVGNSKRKLVFLTPNTTFEPQSKRIKPSPQTITPTRFGSKKKQPEATNQVKTQTINNVKTSKKKIDWRAVFENASAKTSVTQTKDHGLTKSVGKEMISQQTKNKGGNSVLVAPSSKQTVPSPRQRQVSDALTKINNEDSGESKIECTLVNVNEEVEIVEDCSEYDPVNNFGSSNDQKSLRSLEGRINSLRNKYADNDLVIIDEEDSNVESINKSTTSKKIFDEEILLDDNEEIFNKEISEEVVSLDGKTNEESTTFQLKEAMKEKVRRMRNYDKTEQMNGNEEFEVVELLDDPMEPTVEELVNAEKNTDVVQLDDEEDLGIDVSENVDSANSVNPYTSKANEFIERLKAKLKEFDEKSPSKSDTTLTAEQNIIDCF